MNEEQGSLSMTHLPLFQSLTEHVLFAGVPMSALVLLGSISMMFIVFLGFFYILFITVPLYFVCVAFTQNDAQFFDCYECYRSRDKQDYYAT